MATVRHAGIVVSDIERSLVFYCDLLGLKKASVNDETGAFLEGLLAMPGARIKTAKLGGEDGSSLLELLAFEEPAPRRGDCSLHTIGPTHVALTVNDLESLYLRLIDEGIIFNAAPDISPNGMAKVAFCRDPDGTYLELVEELNVEGGAQ